MKKKILTTLISCVLVLSSALLFVSCGKNDGNTQIVNPITISMSITYPKEAKLEKIKDTEVKVEENSTVSDALQLYCNVSEISTTMDTTSSSVTSINKVINDETKKGYTWKFKINGKACEKAPTEVTLKDGDSVEWVYEK